LQSASVAHAVGKPGLPVHLSAGSVVGVVHCPRMSRVSLPSHRKFEGVDTPSAVHSFPLAVPQ
jgi:hypothetical protein